MGEGLKRFVCAGCAIVLAAGLLPSRALAAEVRAAQVAEDDIAQRAQAIDSLGADAFDDGSIIVVYRAGAAETKKAKRGMTAQSVEIAGAADVKAEVLSAESGVADGGASMVVDVPDGVSVGQAVAAAEADPDVVYAQPNFRYHLLDDAPASSTPALPDDPYVSVSENDVSDYPSTANQWWIHSVNAPAAWERVRGEDNPVAVAVLDTGIDFDHEDLKANILADYAYDACRCQMLTESIDNDEMQHGCHVAGIIAAEANNGTGIAGVTYNAKVLPIRVFDFDSSSGRAMCSDEDLIRAYDYLLSDPDGNGKSVAEETRTHVVNMSLGSYLQDDVYYYGGDPMDYYDYAFEAKIREAQEEANILTVAAAGNGENGYARTDESYPSDFDDVMSVMALRTDTTRTRWSDHNAHKNISAPGNNVFSTYWSATEGEAFNGTKYAFESGTSMASPIVAGCAALLWAYDPNLTVQDVKDALYGTAFDLGDDGFDELFGWGRVDAAAAVASLGTASVKGEKSTMVRTDSQTMTATGIADPSAVHEWTWAVTDQATGAPTGKARIDANGKLTALEAGKVVVTATAKDDPAVSGQRIIKITEIQIEDGVSAAANLTENTIALSWSKPDAVKSYRIARATNAEGGTTKPGAFSDLAEVSASSITEGVDVMFVDRSAKVGELYWYQVTPLGELAEDDGRKVLVEGVTSTSNRSFFTDKAALKANIQAAEDLLAETQTSADGSDVGEDAFWTTAAARRPLKTALVNAYSAYASSTMIQSAVDERSAKLAGEIAAFKSARKAGKIAREVKPQPKANPMTVKAKAVSLKAGKSVSAKRAFAVSGAQGAVTFAKASGNAKIAVAKNGKIKVKKKLKKKTYVIKVRVTAAGNDSYLPVTRQVSVKVKVR